MNLQIYIFLNFQIARENDYKQILTYFDKEILIRNLLSLVIFYLEKLKITDLLKYLTVWSMQKNYGKHLVHVDFNIATD